MLDINLEEYDYLLPAEKIPQYPLRERDMSKLLVYEKGKITDTLFNNIHSYIKPDSLLIFNNTKVIKARLLFRKESGAGIEVFCLEPVDPPDYALSFLSRQPVEWKCIIGNLRKWKDGIIKLEFVINGRKSVLSAEQRGKSGEALIIRFTWDLPDPTFGEVIESAGIVPLPPYINRKAEQEDTLRYQTIYSLVRGSVAAPTAGLHFTEDVLRKLQSGGISMAELTLHVGAGTFRPVKSDTIRDHEMHTEHFFISDVTVEKLIKNSGKIVAVGTTSLRAIESLYWLGLKLQPGSEILNNQLFVNQWEPYTQQAGLRPVDSLENILRYMQTKKMEKVHIATRIIIVPGYQFKLTDGLITNFHLPGSTLLLLVSAFTGSDWKRIYYYAMENDFRFLSYGDSSLLYR